MKENDCFNSENNNDSLLKFLPNIHENNIMDPKTKSNKNNDLFDYMYDNDNHMNETNISYLEEKEDNFIFSKTLRNPKDTKFNKYSFRKTYCHTNLEQNEPLFKKRITELLTKNNEKKKNKPKDVNNFEKSLLDILYDEKGEESEENEDNAEENIYYCNQSDGKMKNLVKNLIETKRENEWNEYVNTYKEKVKESQSLKFKLKNILNMKSDFVVIWKTTLRIFHIFILFLFLLKYVFLTLAKEDTIFIEKRILLLYYMVNYMFIIDFIISVLIILFNGGSKLTYFKLPLKIYTCIPFQLKKENFILLLPKFLRIDIFQKIFSSWESYINSKANFYIHNYQIKIFIACLTQIGKYLLIFGLYAHINGCILAYFEGFSYPSSLFYTIEAFTVVGFGEKSPNKIQSLFLVSLNLFVGVNLFSLMTSNIKDLSDKINSFYRETSYWDNFENMTFQIQKSTGKILPLKTKELIISYLLFRKGLSSHDLKEEFKAILSSCKNNLLDGIREQLFEFLKLEYQNYFLKNEDFMYDIFESLKPKIYKKNKTIIKKGEKINKLYFLLNGQIYGTDSGDKPVFLMMNDAILGDYEFITNTCSLFNIKIDPKRNAYGFTLDKNSWEKAYNKHISSANSFIKQIIKKRRTHMKWIKKHALFDSKNDKKDDGDESQENEFYGNISIQNQGNIIKTKNIEQEKNNKYKRITSKKTFSEKNLYINYSNIDIIRCIDEFRANINQIEFNFIDNKELILENIINSILIILIKIILNVIFIFKNLYF